MCLLSCVLYSQSVFKITSLNADCDHPVILNDTVFGPTNPPAGFGKVMEISDEKKSIYYFEKEHNSAWYKFTAPSSCTLTFDIIPVSIKDDYDFILFRYTDKNFCKDVLNKKILPVRSNISRNDTKIKSATGLSKQAKEEYVHSGPGAKFSKALEVNRGEVYYLLLDNVYENGKGHTLKLHYFNCKQLTTNNDQLVTSKVSHFLSISIVDKVTNEPVKATIDIFKSDTKQNKKPLFHFIEKSECSVPLGSLDNKQQIKNNDKLILQVSAKGYLNYTSSEIIIPNNDKRTTNNELKVELEKIEVGKNFKIENIYFVGNKAQLLPGSFAALNHLLNFMTDNSTVNIEIQGHVNYPSVYGNPSKEQDEFNWTLSTDRAKAVFDYLVKNHIPISRMTYKGYGSTQMIFPEATLEKEFMQNRRVEIVITSD